MNWHKTLSFVGLLVLLLTALPTTAQQLQPADKIEERLWEQFSTEGSVDFIVRMAEQADLSPAYSMGWEERGRYVYDTLTEVAGRTQANARAYLDKQGIRYHTFIAGNELYIWSGNQETATSLAALPEVATIRALRTYYFDPILARAEAAPSGPDTLAWGIDYTDADLFWTAFGLQGDGIVVASIDSGVQYNHPALDQAYKCPGDPGSNVCWEDPDNTCPSGLPCDPLGHGTHTMGTMIGDDDPSLQYQAGMAPNAQWISCNAGSPSNYALGVCADWLLAPNGDPANRPNVVNNSWGGGGCDNWYLAKVQAWRAAGIFPGFSAGNSGSSCNSLGSPGDYQESFATAAHNSGGTIADFSSRGPSCYGHDPYTKPNIAAPGVNVCSSVPTNSWDCTYSGTSMSSPHLVGAVALLWSCNPSLRGQINPTFEALQDTARPAPAGNCGAPPDGEGNYTYGYGILNIYDTGLAWCGETGTLDGHVYNAVTSAPIEGATVQAGMLSDITGADGYYAMTLTAGTYTVTAEAFGYYPASTPDVEIVTDTNTVLDFQLNPLPEYVVSGTVTAAGTGAPLAATIEVVGTPLAPVNTNPTTGFYSLEVPEGAYTLHVTAAGYAPEDRDIVADHNQTQNFALYGYCDVFNDTVENGNQGWTPGGYPNTWAITAEASHSPSHSWTDSPGAYYTNNNNNYINSPVFDLTGYTGVTLSFWHLYDTESGWDYCYVEYSTNGGGTWTAAATYDGTISSWEYVELALPQLDNQANARIRFHFTSDTSYTYQGWHVDDIVLAGGGPGCVPPTPPIAAFESSMPACDGTAVAFTNTSNMGFPPADQFLWAFGDGATSTQENPTHLYPGPGSYDVSFELCNTAGCDDVTGTVEVLVAPTAGFTWTADLLTVTFTNSSQGTTTYLWDFGDGITSTLANPVHTYTTTGIYPVTLTAYGDCGQDEYTAQVTVVAVPVAGFDAMTPVCLGEPTAFTNTSLGADTYLWTFGDGDTSTETHPVHLYGAVGDYAVSLEACNGIGCDTVTDTVAVLPLPEATFTFVADLLTVTFTNGSQNATTYQWAFGDGGTSTETNPVHTYAATGTYTVILTATGACGTAEFAAEVSVSLLPEAGFLSNAPVCLGEPTVFTNTSVSADTFLWTFGDGGTSTETNPVHTYAAAGTYDVSLEACRGANCDTARDTVEVRPLPAADFTFVTGLLTVTFTNGSQNATTYQWAFGDGGTSTETNPVHTYAAAGTYPVTLTATGVCGANTTTHDVTVSTTPPAWKIYLPLIVKNS